MGYCTAVAIDQLTNEIRPRCPFVFVRSRFAVQHLWLTFALCIRILVVEQLTRTPSSIGGRIAMQQGWSTLRWSFYRPDTEGWHPVN